MSLWYCLPQGLWIPPHRGCGVKLCSLAEQKNVNALRRNLTKRPGQGVSQVRREEAFTP